MLGERSDQRGLWEADRLYLDHVVQESFYGLLASLRGRLFRDAGFRRVLLPGQRPGQRAGQPAGCGPAATHQEQRSQPVEDGHRTPRRNPVSAAMPNGPVTRFEQTTSGTDHRDDGHRGFHTLLRRWRRPRTHTDPSRSVCCRGGMSPKYPTGTSARQHQPEGERSFAELFQQDLTRILGNQRRRTGGNALNRRFIRRQLNGLSEEIATPQRVDTLRQVFTDDLPTIVENEITELRRLNLTGRELVIRLELLQERYRLNPSEQTRGATTRQQPSRIVCSDGLN